MRYEEAVRELAPCGLSCGRCMHNPSSPIAQSARGLAAELGGFDRMAGRFAAVDPVFGGYPAFAQILERLQNGVCHGCREGGECYLGACGVKDCVRTRGVDFCFQCAEFPCAAPGVPAGLEERWRAMNEKMGEVGVEAFCELSRSRPRY